MSPLIRQLDSLDQEACAHLLASWDDLRSKLSQVYGQGSIPLLVNVASIGERLPSGGDSVRVLEHLADKLGTVRQSWDRLQALEASLRGLSFPSGDLPLQARALQRHKAIIDLATRQDLIRERLRALRASWVRVLQKALRLSSLALRDALPASLKSL